MKPLAFQIFSRLLAAAGSADDADFGFVWRVQVVEYGPGKDGRINWPREPLVAALPLYEGAKVFALNESQHQAGTKPFGKSVREIVGWLKNPADTGSGIEADFYILKSARWLRDALMDSHERGCPDLLGLSHDVSAKAKTVLVAGKKMQQPVEVLAVEVDVVYSPTNNGKFIRLAAAAAESEDQVNREQLLAALKKVRPNFAADELSDEQLLAALVDAAEKKQPEGISPEKLTAAIAAELKGLLTPTGPTESELELRKLLAAQRIDRALDASKLPAVVQAKLRKTFDGQTPTDEQLHAAITAEKDVLDQLTASGIVTGVGAPRIILDQADKTGQYLDDFFDGKVSSFKAAYVDITGDRDLTGKLSAATRLSAAIASSTFAEALGDAITRRMLKEYNASGLDSWRKIVGVVPVTDFRTQRRPRVGGYGDLPGVNQAAAYSALSSPGDEEATYAATKRGGIETVTLEAISNDDVGLIRRIPQKLGRAAARTLYKFVFDFLATNPTIYDSVALFHGTHGNLGATALSAITLKAARLAMMKQAEAGSSEPLGIPPRFLIVPADLEDAAYELTVQPNVGAFTPTAPDAVKRQTWEIIAVKTWSDVNNWYLCADPADLPTIEIGFFGGKEQPELFVQDLPNVGSMFSNDQLTYKIRHIYGGAVMDYRGLYGAVVA